MSAPQAGAPTPGERDRERAGKIVAEWRGWWGKLVDQWPEDVPQPDVPGFPSRLSFANDIANALSEARAEGCAEGHSAGLEAARNEEQESLRRIAVQASALGDCECSEEIGELCNRCALVDIIGRRIAAIRALAGADQKGARG